MTTTSANASNHIQSRLPIYDTTATTAVVGCFCLSCFVLFVLMVLFCFIILFDLVCCILLSSFWFSYFYYLDYLISSSVPSPLLVSLAGSCLVYLCKLILHIRQHSHVQWSSLSFAFVKIQHILAAAKRQDNCITGTPEYVCYSSEASF